MDDYAEIAASPGFAGVLAMTLGTDGDVEVLGGFLLFRPAGGDHWQDLLDELARLIEHALIAARGWAQDEF